MKTERLLAVDIGNSHSVSGVFVDGRLAARWRLKSDRDRTADELAIRYHSLFSMAGLSLGEVNGFVMAGVVPTIETAWMQFVEKYLADTLSAPPVTVTSETDCGISIETDNPAEVGADRIVNSVAAWSRYHDNLIVVDFGTAITFDCVTDRGQYVGGAILPGISISLDALAGRTSKLPRIDISRAPRSTIGRNTVDAIRSGMLHGFGGMIDKLTTDLAADLAPGRNRVTVVATGGMAHLIAPYAATIDEIDPMLTLTGLRLIHERVRSHG